MSETGLLRATANPGRIAVTDERLAEALQPRFYVMMRRIVDRDRMKAVQKRHLDWMLEKERGGVLFLSGPATCAFGSATVNGFTVLRAKDAEEARSIADSEPFIAEGVMEYDLYEWTIFEGIVAMSVTLSSGRSAFC